MTTISRYITQLLAQYQDDKLNGHIPERQRVKFYTLAEQATQELTIKTPIKYFGDRGEGSELKRLKTLRMELERVLDMNQDQQSVLEDHLEMFILSTHDKQACLKAHEAKLKLELAHLNKKLKGVK